MPLVFIHGVATRRGPNYDETVAFRDALFESNALTVVSDNPRSVLIFNPFWGDLGVTFSHDLASIPSSSVEKLGSASPAPAWIADWPIQLTAGNSLVQSARTEGLAFAVDLLFTAFDAPDSAEAAPVAELATKLIAYAEANPKPRWLMEIANDQTFGLRLQRDAEQWWSLQPAPLSVAVAPQETLGGRSPFETGWRYLNEARKYVTGSVARAIMLPALDLVRAPATRSAATFLGDVFRYLDGRGGRDNPGPIVQRIAPILAEANECRGPADPSLIVVGHSMGGNIAYDALRYYRPEIHVDVLVTVGSQVGLFQELGLFDHGEGTSAEEKPHNIGSWLNVFDEADVLGFAAEPIFTGAKDYMFSTHRSISAHSSYLRSPGLHRRLAERLVDLHLPRTRP